MQSVEVRTSPPGAAIFVDGARLEAESPTTVQLGTSRGHTVRLRLAGHREQTVRLERTSNAGGFVVPVLLGTLAGAIIGAAVGMKNGSVTVYGVGGAVGGLMLGFAFPAATGSDYKLTPETVDAPLTPLSDRGGE